MSKQQTRFLTDLFRRKARYAGDLNRCAPLWFEAGKVFYSGGIGLLSGNIGGGLLAAAFNVAVTGYVASRQMKATYEGEKFDTPYRVNAASNFFSAAVLTGSALLFAPATLPFMVVPVAMNVLWGVGSLHVAGLMKKIETMRKAGLSDDAIATDPAIVKKTRLYQTLYGAADLASVIKDKSISEIGDLLARPYAQPDLALPIVLHALGIKKAIGLKTSFDRAAGKMAGAVMKKIPENIQAIFINRDKGVTPNTYFTAGHALTSAFSFIKSLASPVHGPMAAAFALWARGYRQMDEIERTAPQSADAHARANGLLPAAQ